MRSIFLVLVALFAVVHGQVAFQCANKTAPNYVMASNIKCDLDLRAQCGCGSWCGISGPMYTDDTTPKCYPAIDTPDAPPPTPEGGNPCQLQDCPVQPFTLVLCPNGTIPHQYVGASCNKVGSACVWQLPYCDPVWPPPNARCTRGDAGCPAMPTSPPQGELNIVNCTGWWKNKATAHYECVENGAGGCRWNWVPCPGNTTCPMGMNKMQSSDCADASTPGCSWNSPSCPSCAVYPTASCGSPSGNMFAPDYCGGCNCHVTSSSTGADVCAAQTWAAAYNDTSHTGVQCADGYTYAPTFPYCFGPSYTCQNLTCGKDETCFEIATYQADLHLYVPQCWPTPRVPNPFTLPCSAVGCSPGYSCQTDSNGYWSCVLGNKTCVAGTDCTDATKTVCWDGSKVGGPGCTFRHTGQCEWDFVACPAYNVPATTGTKKNCQVSAWSEWTCGAPCGMWSKLTRIRSITQNATTGGQACPPLLEAAADCQGNSTFGCAKVTNSSIVSEFTSGTMPATSYATGVATTSGGTPGTTPGGTTSGGTTPTSGGASSSSPTSSSTPSSSPSSGTTPGTTPGSTTAGGTTPTSGGASSSSPTSSPATTSSSSVTPPGGSSATGIIGSFVLWVCTVLALSLF